MDGSPRLVSLVLIDPHSENNGAVNILGITDAREVADPWWPEVPPIVEAFGPLVILRLLEVEKADDRWHVTYLAELPASSEEQLPLDDLALTPWSGSLEPSEYRMPWAEVGGPAAALDWANDRLRFIGLEPTAAPLQHKTWNLSSLWELRHKTGSAWLKTLAPFGRHEGAVLDLLSDHAVPTLLAYDDSRLLLDSMPGVDGFRATLAERIDIVDTLVDIQLASVPLVGRAIERGVPDLREGPITEALVGFVDSQMKTFPALRRVAVELPKRLAELHNCGLPITMVHGDAHPGNARIGQQPPLVFDWADSFIGSPLWDLSRVLDEDDPEQRQVRDHWVSRWSEVPGSSPERGAELMFALAPLRAAWLYQEFLDAIEPSERIYHQHDVPEQLTIALERW